MAPPKEPSLNQSINTRTQTLNTPAEALEVIQFWRDAGAARWFAKDDAFDAEIRRRFLPLVEAAQAGGLDDWGQSADGALALMLLLDQFPRNLFRGSPQAFAGDASACKLADAAIAQGFDREVAPDFRPFFYLPFMHSEALADQERSLELYRILHSEGGTDNRAFAEDHHAIIARFGRFPHRNAVLGRSTTPEEQAFLDDGGFKG
jgi:uncharacterized protein (DUF924 family)